LTGAPALADRVLVVDDEPDIVALVVYHLAKAGYTVSSATSGTDALAIAKRDRPSLVVLDLMLPGLSGFDVLEQLREDPDTANIAVLMLTARKEEPDRIRGFELGADDYLTKPFSPPELVLRVGAILRRLTSSAAPHDVQQAGPIHLDRSAHRVTVAGIEVELTRAEYMLLATLTEHVGRVQSRAQLLSAALGSAPDLQTRTVDTHILRLRAKLGAAGDMIETVRGFGYVLRPPAQQAG
jgi:two-component system phosphate regulon response regulator PhoB